MMSLEDGPGDYYENAVGPVKEEEAEVGLSDYENAVGAVKEEAEDDGPGDYENAVGPVKEEAEDERSENYFMDTDDVTDEDDWDDDWAYKGAVDRSHSRAYHQLTRLGFRKRSKYAPRLSHEQRVRMGYFAAKWGIKAAKKKFGVKDGAVRGMYKLVQKLVREGTLSLDIPLEKQVIPPKTRNGVHIPSISLSQTSDPDKPPKRGRGRPRKHAAGRPGDNPSRPLMSALVSGNYRGRMVRQSRPQISNGLESVQDRACESPVTPSNPPHRDAKSDQQPRGRRDISLATDLAFLRWTKKRTSLGFRSDQAFAMHLMDVHDVFCADQCNGGGRHEQYQNGREVKTEKDQD